MEKTLLKVFHLQVLDQCRFVILAAEQVNTGLRQPNVTMVFFGLQNLLNASANISKALWGEKGRLAKERQDLRDSIGITNDSPLKTTVMRNNFEHFDERIDVWWKNSETHMYYDHNLGPVRAMINSPESSKYDWFRNFNPATTELSFWGEDFNLQELVTEVDRILPKLESVCAFND